MSKRKGIMLCYPFEEKRLAKWKPPYGVQPKLDGERCIAKFNEEISSYELFSSEGNKIISVNHIVDSLNRLRTKITFDGELYNHSLTMESIHSIVSRTKIFHTAANFVQYHIFDTINTNTQFERLFQITRLKYDENIHLISTHSAENFNQVMCLYEKFLSDGYEGMIVRHLGVPYIPRRSLYMMKFKPKKSDFYEVVGFQEEMSIQGEPKNRLGSLLCCGDDGTTFNVGSGLTDDQRVELWNRQYSLVGNLVHVQYQHLTSARGVPRFPVFLDIIERSPNAQNKKEITFS